MIFHTGLEELPSKTKMSIDGTMGQVFKDSSDQCGSGMGQNLRKWEKN